MRLWSIHPKYLDAQGLVALWREGLLAKKVLEGKTRGYKHHPQLIRFYQSANPMVYINAFLAEVYKESVARCYRFDKTKIDISQAELPTKIPVTHKQVDYEFAFLQKKLEKRNFQKYLENQLVTQRDVNALFKIVAGGIESWERVKAATLVCV